MPNKLGKPIPGILHRRCVTYLEAQLLGVGHTTTLIATSDDGRVLFWRKKRAGSAGDPIILPKEKIDALEAYWTQEVHPNRKKILGAVTEAYGWIDKI